jgi:hypothetical protein
MRKLLLFSITLLMLGTACNNKKKAGDITIEGKDGEKVTINTGELQKMAEKAEESNSKVEELKKLTPLSLDQLKALIPEEFMGMKRSRFNANSMMGAATCNANYKSEDGKELKVSIFDCAGEAGAGIYSLRYWTLWNFQQEDDNGYQKTVDFNGSKAIEKYRKSNEEYGLTYMSGDRFLVTIEGENTGLDLVKDAAKNLNVKAN